MENSIDKQNIQANSNQSASRDTLVNARKSALLEQQKRKPFDWLTDHSRNFLASGYLTDNVTPETRIREIANRAQEILGVDGYADKFYHYMSQGFFSLASPVWSNFGKIRHRGAAVKNNGQASGSVHIMQLFETMVDVVSQGSVRRGRFSPYLPVEHHDINEFLDIGTEGNPIQELTHGVSVTDKWMEEMIAGDTEKRNIWAKVIQRRGEIGYPYIFFKDKANSRAADVYQDKNHEIYASNLCTEIMLPSNDKWSFVCVLSSLNVLHYDKWKDTDAVETMVYFLDAVITEFTQKLEQYRDSNDLDDKQTFLFMERAYNFAKDNRALGLGVLGWHSLLQSKMLPFNSQEAFNLNSEIFKLIKEKSYQASKELADLFGEPEVLKGYGRRNATLNAIAPTTSSAFILGQVSQGIEPIWSNIYVKDIAKIKTTIKNPFLLQLLEQKEKNNQEVWRSIRDRDGSVQHLDFLSDLEKDVFKTYSEIDQMDIVYQAANRQSYIDQGQSLNIIVHPEMPVKEINKIYITAWKLGLKSLYYQHSMNAAQKFKQKKDCASCEA